MSKWFVLLAVVLVGVAATASGDAPRDRDHDGLPDRWERQHHLSTHTSNAKRDPDRDRLTNRREYRLHTNPQRADTDRDRLRDGAEVRRYHTNPRKRDTDRDGLRDGAEVRRYHTNPRKRDTDGDGYSDGREVRAGTNPRNPRSHPAGSPQPPSTDGGCPLPAYPGAGCTGVPAGTSLSAYTGPSTISTANTVISGKTMGCITVKAPGVVIRDSKLSCADTNGVVGSFDGDYLGTPLVVEDSEIDCKNGPGTAVSDTNVTVRRANIHGCENGFDINARVTVEDSYIHDLYDSAEAHPDGIQLASGHLVDGHSVAGALDVTIRHNTIYAMALDGSFANAAIISNRGADVNILIQANLLAGGGYTLYCEQGSTGHNYRVIDNHFSRRFSSRVGHFGPTTDCSDEIHSGNIYHESRRSVSLG